MKDALGDAFAKLINYPIGYCSDLASFSHGAIIPVDVKQIKTFYVF